MWYPKAENIVEMQKAEITLQLKSEEGHNWRNHKKPCQQPRNYNFCYQIFPNIRTILKLYRESVLHITSNW